MRSARSHSKCRNVSSSERDGDGDGERERERGRETRTNSIDKHESEKNRLCDGPLRRPVSDCEPCRYRRLKTFGPRKKIKKEFSSSYSSSKKERQKKGTKEKKVADLTRQKPKPRNGEKRATSGQELYKRHLMRHLPFSPSSPFSSSSVCCCCCCCCRTPFPRCAPRRWKFLTDKCLKKKIKNMKWPPAEQKQQDGGGGGGDAAGATPALHTHTQTRNSEHFRGREGERKRK